MSRALVVVLSTVITLLLRRSTNLSTPLAVNAAMVRGETASRKIRLARLCRTAADSMKKMSGFSGFLGTLRLKLEYKAHRL